MGHGRIRLPDAHSSVGGSSPGAVASVLLQSLLGPTAAPRLTSSLSPPSPKKHSDPSHWPKQGLHRLC